MWVALDWSFNPSQSMDLPKLMPTFLVNKNLTKKNPPTKPTKKKHDLEDSHVKNELGRVLCVSRPVSPPVASVPEAKKREMFGDGLERDFREKP